MEPDGTAYDRATINSMAPSALEAVTTTLKGKGYEEGANGDADLLVRMRGKFVQNFMNEKSVHTGTPAPDIQREGAEHRVFLMEILENRTGNVLWSDSRTRSSVGTPTAERARVVIAEMLAAVPEAGR